MASQILVIEDNPPNLELMIYLLEAFGHQPLAAHTGEEGLEIIQREKLDLIICDIQLPGIDGYRIARWLKSNSTFSRIPLVAVTAFAMVGDRDRVLGAGFDGYIPKPISPETFVRDVEVFLKPSNGSTEAKPAPRSAETRLGEEPAAIEKRRRSKEHCMILAVDNSAINLSLARSILEPLGFDLVTTEDVNDALEVARKLHPDLLLSDVHMPQLDGFDFIRAAKADPELRSIPFVFISSTVLLESDRKLALALGAAKFITRPIEPLALVAEIQSCLREDNSK
jgi:two-component system cell cycle response regulator